MAAHTNAWNNATPVGSDLASSIDDFFRALKVDIDERMSLGHYWGDATAEGINQDGTHRALVVNPIANTSILKTNANQSLTGSDATPAVDLGITWNTTGVPTALKVNITNTASGANSMLFDLQIGGVSRFSVDKIGNIRAVSAANVNLLLGGGAASEQTVEFRANAVLESKFTNFAGSVYWDSDGSWNFRTLNAATNRLTISNVGDVTAGRNLVTPTIANNTAYLARNSAATAISMLGMNGSNAMFVGNSDAASVGSMTFFSGSTFLWNAAGTTLWNMSATAFYPQSNNTHDLGGASNRVRVGYFQTLNVVNGGTAVGSSGNLSLSGGLLTGGDITSNSNSAIISVGNNIATLAMLQGGDSSGATQRGANLRLMSNAGAGYIGLEAISGTEYYLWVDTAGKLRIGTNTPHGGGDTSGSLVGLQS